MRSSTRRWLGIMIVAVITAAALPAPWTRAAESDPRLKQATQAFTDHKTYEGLKILHALGSDAKAGYSDRLKAFWKLLEAYHHNKDVEHAIVTTKEMIAAFPHDEDLLQQVYVTQAKLWWSIHKAEEAVEACHQAVAHAADDKQNAVMVRFQAASYLGDSKNFARLYDEASELLRLLEGDPRAADALWYLSEATWQTGRYEECIEKTRRILAEYPHAAAVQNRSAHGRVAECLRKLGKPREVLACYEEWEKKDSDSRWRQKWCLTAAECCLADKDPAAALAAYRRVIAGHCGDNVSELWCEAQRRIVDLLTASGDLKAALQEAHILFNASQPHTITPDALRIVGLFTSLDKNRDRADRFLAYQCYGPDGMDGKPGTDDDLTNPLDEIGYPADPQRKQAFAKVFAHLGNDAAAAYHRGMICVYGGQPDAALYYFMDAFRRCDAGKFQDYALVLVVNGLRGVRGHCSGLGDDLRFVLFGPGGEDGKSAAQDPFQAYASHRPAAPFTCPPAAEKDVQLLEKLQASLMVSAADATWPSSVRMKTFSVLARLNEALDTWPKNADWYCNLLLTSTDAGLKSAILNGAISASKGNVLHLGNVRVFLASLDSVNPIGKKVLARQGVAVDKNLRHILQVLDQLNKPGGLTPKVKRPHKGKN